MQTVFRFASTLQKFFASLTRDQRWISDGVSTRRDYKKQSRMGLPNKRSVWSRGSTAVH